MGSLKENPQMVLCRLKEFWADDNTFYLGLVTQYNEAGNEYD
ncbi:hypothetical protein SAMN04487894_107171 [Niabella drilacis]|uniref:Uncharacterized protein n=1 Tax=Niabella drilacis (strain DSM 25811 / CCM 8410 / CCUG 62505 / LMG 26954 / E90) TaxID=1285928 RepID=A0A1G6TCE8_NIADE|nr:hypothetical protein SAMN04487894_107171 [Niabella drilacis]